MKKLLLLLPFFLLANCATPNSKTGGVLGGGVGAIAGAIIGDQKGRALEGAAIGGVIGAGAGAILGDAYDQVHYRDYNRYKHNNNYPHRYQYPRHYRPQYYPYFRPYPPYCR